MEGMAKLGGAYLTVPDAADMLGVSEKTIRNWIADGYVGIIQPAGRGHTIRIERQELLRSERREEAK
jgi:excisionase family DNA binding protein